MHKHACTYTNDIQCIEVRLLVKVQVITLVKWRTDGWQLRILVVNER